MTELTRNLPSRRATLVAGSAVRARVGASDFGPAGTRWFAGVVTSANDDGTFAVQYNDGDYEDSLLPEYIQSINEEETDKLIKTAWSFAVF